MRKLLISLIAGASLITAGCSTDYIPGVYKIDVQQGNVITEEMLARLKPGMEKRRVQYILGTPLIKDHFRDDRWDYLYSYKHGNDQPERRRVTVIFENSLLDHVEGDIVAETGKPFAEDYTPKRTVITPTKQKSFFERMLDKATGKEEEDL